MPDPTEVKNVFGETVSPPDAAVAGDTAADGPHVPQVDHTPQTPEEVSALAAEFANYRKEVAALRADLAANRVGPRPLVVAADETEGERLKKRLEAIAAASHYCPGCGTLSTYMRECRGTTDGPHKPLDMVSTEELHGDPANHTPAPNTDELAA